MAYGKNNPKKQHDIGKPEKSSKGDVTEMTTLNFDREDIVKAKEGYVPEGFKTLDDYLADLRETYDLDVEFDHENRVAAMQDKKFVAGEQWDPLVLHQRIGLPCLSLNTIPQFLGQLVGDWRENRNAVKVLPAESGQVAVADIRSDLIRSIETRGRADRVFDNAFESMVACGDGAFRVGIQYTSDDVFDQEIVLGAIDDCLSVVWDRMSLDPTGRDAKHCFVDDLMPKKEFTKTWPEADPSRLSSSEKKDMKDTKWIDESTVRVTEHWRIIERKRFLAMFADGSIHRIDEEDEDAPSLEELKQVHGDVVKSRLAPVRFAQMHLVTGYALLGGPYEYRLDRLPIIRMAGRTVSVGERRVRFGLVRFMKDAVRLRNFWRSVAAEQLGYAPKAQWIAPESAVEGREEQFRKAHLSRDPLLVYNDDASAPPERIEPPAIQTALLNESQVNAQDMKDITGIHDASLGIKSNETSGRAIMARQREGDVASLTYYDNGNAAIMEAGDVINQLIPQIYDGTRIVRVIGEDESSKLIKINDPMDPTCPDLAVGKYDVAMTTGASYTTRRVEAAEAMMEAIQVYPELMQVAGDLVVKAQDWPGAEDLSERLLRTIPPQLLSQKEQQAQQEAGGGQDMQALMQQQQQLQQVVQQGMQEIQKLQQENFALKVKVDVENKRLEIDEFKAETDRLNAYAALAQARDSHNLNQLETESSLAMEREKMEADNNAANRQFALDAHDQINQHAMQQQSQDDAAAQADQEAQDRDTLTQLKVRQLQQSYQKGQPSKNNPNSTAGSPPPGI